MKISILTPTYNRAKLLEQLYHSLIENVNYDVAIEWLIMDDGSMDETKKVIENFREEGKIEIKYYRQENQGKMVAINNLVQHATGDLIVDCDSDDYFTKDAFKIIKEEYEKNKKAKGVYALCFLKYNTKGENMGNTFTKDRTTMFDLHFKEKEEGEKVLVFFSTVRKKYKHELERKEKFITEARMYYKMDESYQIICINKPVIISEYQQDGYTQNIKKQFLENPYGYYQYFKEILKKDFKGVKFSKRLYAIKHYILFSYLIKQYQADSVKGLENKALYYILFVPGMIKSRQFRKMTKKLLTNKGYKCKL